MPTITELPNDAAESVGSAVPDSDRQLQPMGHEHSSTGNSTNAPAQRDAGMVSITVYEQRWAFRDFGDIEIN